jgi:nucleoside-diphosphate-sugar epimerase
MFKMRFTGLRFFTVYGERMRPDLGISKFANAILDKQAIRIYGDGSQMRDFTYIGDVVDAIMTVMESDKKWKCEVFDVGRGYPITINKVIDVLKDILYEEGFDNIVYEKPKPYDVKLTVANSGKIRDFLGFVCKTGIDDGLEKYISWLMEQKKSVIR